MAAEKTSGVISLMQSAKSTTTIQIRGDKRLIAQGGYAYDQSLLNALTLKVYGQGIRQCIGHKQDIDMKKHDYKSYVVVMHYGIDSRKDKKGEPIINPFLTKNNGTTQTHVDCIRAIVDHAEQNGIAISILDQR